MGTLADLVRVDHILVDTSATSSDEIIRALASTLVDSEHVAPGYADACIAREATDPTGLPMPGAAVAIPHADPELVIEPAVAIGTPSRPVVFQQMDEPDLDLEVSAVFLLALDGAGSQLAALRQVAEFVQDATRLDALISAETADEVRDIIAAHSKEPSS